MRDFSLLLDAEHGKIESYFEYSELFTLVESKISRLLPGHFALVLDSWSNRDTHYLAVYATFPDGS